jgi:hypothetical protein
MIRSSRILIFMLLPLFVEVSLASERFYLSAAEWARPRSGQMVVSIPAIKDAVTQLSHDVSSMLTIYYPGGDLGAYWGEELRGWLIALGVASSRIEMVPGSGEADMIALEVIEY